jgi:DNA-binding FadR family transcriptional regulator
MRDAPERRDRAGSRNEADIRFHQTIVKACDDEVLEQVSAIVNTTLLVAFHAAIRIPGLPPSSLPRHQALLDAIRRRQPDRARAAMRLLVQNTGRQIRKLRR